MDLNPPVGSRDHSRLSSGCQELRRVLPRQRQNYSASAFAFSFTNAGSDPLADVDDCKSAEVTELHQFTPVGDLAHPLQPASLGGVMSPWRGFHQEDR